MDNSIIKTTTFRDNPGCKVFLEEKHGGQKHVRKLYANSMSNDEEWDALCFLYNSGFNVPEPYKKDEQGIYMQYIDNGMLWNCYQTADTVIRHELHKKFPKLLFDLHSITPKNAPAFDGFIKNELEEIKNIIEKKQLDKYLKIHSKLEVLSTSIKKTHHVIYIEITMCGMFYLIAT